MYNIITIRKRRKRKKRQHRSRTTRLVYLHIAIFLPSSKKKKQRNTINNKPLNYECMIMPKASFTSLFSLCIPIVLNCWIKCAHLILIFSYINNNKKEKQNFVDRILKTDSFSRIRSIARKSK